MHRRGLEDPSSSCLKQNQINFSYDNKEWDSHPGLWPSGKGIKVQDQENIILGPILEERSLQTHDFAVSEDSS